MDVRYEDLGEIHKSEISSGGATLTLAQETKVLSVSAQARRENNTGITPFAEVGVGHYESDVSLSLAGVSGSLDDEGTTLIYGIGAEYKPAPNWGIKGGLRRYESVGDEDAGTLDTHVDTTYLSVVFNFH